MLGMAQGNIGNRYTQFWGLTPKRDLLKHYESSQICR
jgi:hypothetical protein